MSKDLLGHGSNARGAAKAESQLHQQMRRAIQMSPDAPHDREIQYLTSRGYRANDIQRLRQDAGAAVTNAPAAHQTAVEAARNVGRHNLLAADATPADLKKFAGIK
jgi:HJR/Mrr/RecB family endonuclease